MPETIIEDENNNLEIEYVLDDFLPTQGRYPSNIKSSILNKLPIDKTYTGIHLDSGKIFSSVIHEEKEVKTLLAFNILSTEDRSLDPVSTTQDFNQAR